MNKNETLGKWFRNNPSGKYCWTRMPQLQAAELWRWPVTNCLSMIAQVITTEYETTLGMVEMTTGKLVPCWRGVPENLIACRIDKFGRSGPPAAVYLKWDHSDAATEEEQAFSLRWSEAVLAFDCKLSVQSGRLLSRRPSCWSEHRAIIEILTRLSERDLNVPVPILPSRGNVPYPLWPSPINGWHAWDNWRLAQDTEVRTELGDLVARLAAEKRYPVELTLRGL